MQQFITGYAPDVRGNAVFLFQNLLCLKNFVHDGSAAEQLSIQFGIFLYGSLEAINAFQNALTHVLPGGHFRHGQWLVGDGQVIEDGLLVYVHALDAVLDDDGDLICECRVISQKVGHSQHQHMTVAILVLQAFASKSGPPRGATEQEAATTHVCRGPDQVTDPLETKHGIINKEWDRIYAVIGVGRTRCDERAHRTSFGNAFFENLAVLGFLVIEQGVHIDGLVELADTRVNADLPEKRFHAEGAGFVGDDGDDQFTDFRIAQELRKQADEDHGGGRFATVGALIELLKMGFGNGFQRSGANLALGQIAAELLTTLLHVPDFGAVIGGPVKRRFVEFAIRNGDAKARAEQTQFFVVQLLL